MATAEHDVFEYDVPEDMDAGGNFLRAEGSYHLIVTDVNTRPTNKAGQLMNGWRVAFGVLAGTVDGQRDKVFDLMLFAPSLDAKDGGVFAKIKQSRFLRAVGLLTDDDRGKKKQIDISQARGRQCVARLELDEDGKYPRLVNLDIFHVDDADVKDVPKCEKSLARIPADQRLISGKSADGKEQTYQEPAKEFDVNFDDI